MLIRCRHGRCVQTYLKFIAGLFLAICYCTFLFRESLNALEQNNNKDKTAVTTVFVINKVLELKEEKKTNQLNKFQKEQTLRPTTIKHEEETTASTLNPVYDYSEEQYRSTDQDLQRRHEHLMQVCSKYNLRYTYPPNPWEFFISSGHNLIWCSVFKAASSTWMYYFNILGGYDIKFLQRTETQPLQLARKRFPRPDLVELLENLPSSISFIFVREPFQRLLSGYRDKLEGARNAYYKPMGRKIVHKFRQHAQLKIHGPTFEEFLQFLIDQHAKGKSFDEHWAPIYSFCTPCSVNFTIIAKTETFHRDSEFIIRQAGLESLLLDTLPKHKMRKIGNQAKVGTQTDEVIAARYFSQINRYTLDQLLKIYHLDFELFDYDYYKYYNYVQPVEDGSSTTLIPTKSSPNNGTFNN